MLPLVEWLADILPAPFKRGLYRFKPLAFFIRGSLNRLTPQGLTQVRLAGGDMTGLEMRLDLQTEKDYWLGNYEPELRAALVDQVKPGMVVYDVGANIGYFSLLLARLVGTDGQVIAFEALPANLDRLRLNLALNHLSGQVKVQSAAVVDCERSVRFGVGPSGAMGKADGSAGRENVSYSEVIEVPGISLDAFVYQSSNPPPQVIKMDIEGGEVLALPGMRAVLVEARPIVFLELHGEQAAAVAWQVFLSAGYKLARLAPGYPAVMALDALDWKSYLAAFPMD